MPRNPASWARRLWLSVALLALLAVMFAALVAGRAFYYAAQDVGGKAPPTALLDHPEQAGIAGLTTVSFDRADGTLICGWYVPARNRAAIIITTGTSANRADMLPEVRILANAGFGVLAFDWPGTGASRGRIDWGDPAVAALRSATDWLSHRPDVDPERIGALGFSGGGMVTVRAAAADTRLRAVVLSGTDSEDGQSAAWFHRSARPLHELPTEWAGRYYGWPVGIVKPALLVAQISPRPVFLIGGTADIYATPKEVARMCAAARDPKECWVVPGATHGGYASAAPQEYAARLREFFTRGLLSSAQ